MRALLLILLFLSSSALSLSLSVAAYSRPLPEVLERNLPYEKVQRGYSAFDRTDNRKEDQICSIQMFYLCTSLLLDAAIIGWGKCCQCTSPGSRGFGGGNFVYRRRTARAAPKAMCKHAGRDTNINKDATTFPPFPSSLFLLYSSDGRLQISLCDQLPKSSPPLLTGADRAEEKEETKRISGRVGGGTPLTCTKYSTNRRH